jgi:hypothetical protein
MNSQILQIHQDFLDGKYSCEQFIKQKKYDIIIYQDNYYDNKIGDYGYCEMAFRCVCMLGQDVPKTITKYSQKAIDNGWKIKRDSVFTKELFQEALKQNFEKKKEFNKKLEGINI